MSSILAAAQENQRKKEEEDRKRAREYKAQQERFYAEVARRQIATGQGIGGRDAEKYASTKEGKKVAKQASKQGLQVGDVRDKAVVEQEARAQAVRDFYAEQPKKSLQAGQRDKVTGERTLRVTGERPVQPTEADIQARLPSAREKVTERRIIEGKQRAPGVIYGKSNEDVFVQYRLLKQQAQAQGADINRATVRTTVKEEDGKFFETTTAKAKFETIKKPEPAVPIIQGIEIVGEPSKPSPLAVPTEPTVTTQTEEEFLAEKLKQGLRFTGVKTTDPITGETQYEFEDLKARDEALRKEAKEVQRLKGNAAFIGYSVQAEYNEKGEVVSYSFVPREGQDQFTVRNEAGTDVTGEFLRGEITKEQEARLTFERNPNPKRFDPNLAEQLYRSTAGFGGNLLAGLLDLAGEGEVRLYEALGGDTEQAEKFRESGKKVTANIRESTSLKALGKFYTDIGKATGSKVYIAAGQHATEQAKDDVTPVIGPIEAAGGALAGAFGSPEGKQIVESFKEQTERRPLETAVSASIDIGTIFTGGSATAAKAGASVVRAIKTAGNVARKTKVTTKVVKDRPIKLTSSEAKQAALEDIFRVTGEKISPSDVRTVGMKTIRQGDKVETVPVKKGEKPSSYELVTKEGTTVAVVTKKGVTVTTQQALDVGQAGKAVGQRVSRSGQRLEDVAPTKPEELIAKEYTEFVESEAKGLRAATPERPVGTTQEPSGAVFTESEKAGLAKPVNKPDTFIVDVEGTARAPRTQTTGTLTFGAKESLKAQRERRITENILEQSEKYHNTPKEVLRFLDDIAKDPQIRAKVAKTERLLEKPRRELSDVDDELLAIDDELSQISAQRTAIQEQQALNIPLEGEAVSSSFADELAELAVREEKLVADKIKLQTKRAEIEVKIKSIQEKRKIRRGEFLGARQRVYKRYIEQQDTPLRRLDKQKITKQSAPGFSPSGITGVGSGQVARTVGAPVKTVPAKVKGSVVEEAFAPTKELPKVDTRVVKGIGLGGAVSDYTSKETLGLGGKTGVERKRRRQPAPEEPELVFTRAPDEFSKDLIKPFTESQPEKKKGIGVRDSPRSIVEDIVGTRTTRKLVDTTKVDTRPSVVQVPVVDEIIVPKTQPTIGETTRVVPRVTPDSILIPDVRVDVIPALDIPTRQFYKQRIPQKPTDDIPVPKPRFGIPLRPFGGGGVGGAQSIGRGRAGATKTSKLAIANILYPSLSLRGTGEQAKGAERLLGLSEEKPKVKGKKKRRKSILEL